MKRDANATSIVVLVSETYKNDLMLLRRAGEWLRELLVFEAGAIDSLRGQARVSAELAVAFAMPVEGP